MNVFVILAVVMSALGVIPPPCALAERLPVPYVARGACPFECCTYGTWIARRPLRVYSLERDRSTVAFTLSAQDSFVALTGNVHILRPGLAVARQAFSLNGFGGRINVSPGDRIYILDCGGEGGLHVWHKGRFAWTSAEYFYFDSATPNNSPERVTRLRRDVASEWWVHVRTRDGRQGWLLMEDAPDLPLAVDGADACG